MPLRKLDALLDASDELKALSMRTRRVRELQTLYVRSAPPELASSSRVKNYRAGMLFIWADNAAVAAKLKQLAPSLLASIRKTEAEITGIRIEVQVSGAAHERRPRPKKIALPVDAIEKFEELSKRIGRGDLELALKRLVRRHRAGKVRKPA